MYIHKVVKKVSWRTYVCMGREEERGCSYNEGVSVISYRSYCAKIGHFIIIVSEKGYGQKKGKN